MINAKVIADSKNEFGNRITTMVVTFPRIILAEFNTHRMFSRNSASSRAIPFEKMVKSVEENPFIPMAWQKDHKGMQGSEYLNWFKECKVWNNQLTDFETLTIKDAWLDGRDKMIEVAKNLSKSEVTKQLCNRLLEPFMWHTVLITATEWENFFHLRCPKYELNSPQPEITPSGIFRSRKDYANHIKESTKKYTNGHESISVEYSELEWLRINKGQAEIHMMVLAEAMWDAYNESTPKELKAGEWHIPFKPNVEDPKFYNMCLANPNFVGDYLTPLIKVATARCARVSYTVVGEEGKEPNYEEDIKLHDRLAESGHWSPFEHCAKAMTQEILLRPENSWSGNFRGFIQYRKTFQNENIT